MEEHSDRGLNHVLSAVTWREEQQVGSEKSEVKDRT